MTSNKNNFIESTYSQILQKAPNKDNNSQKQSKLSSHPGPADSNKGFVDPAMVSTSLHVAQQKRVMNSVIELGQHDAEVREQSEKAVQNKQRNKNNTVLGINNNKCQIMAIESRREIFISRLHPETTAEQVRQHLDENKIKALAIEKLQIISNQVAAFKITVPQSEANSIQNSEVWPKYTIIRQYRRENIRKLDPMQMGEGN